MKLLLETCTLSELNRQEGHSGVRGLVATTADTDLFLSVISFGDFTKGIVLHADEQQKEQLSRSGVPAYFTAFRIVFYLLMRKWLTSGKSKRPRPTTRADDSGG